MEKWGFEFPFQLIGWKVWEIDGEQYPIPEYGIIVKENPCQDGIE